MAIQEILPPFMVNSASMTGTGQLPKFEEDLLKLKVRIIILFLLPKFLLQTYTEMKYYRKRSFLYFIRPIPRASGPRQDPMERIQEALSEIISSIK